MKVKIQQRSVYHKFAEVEIEIDKKDFESQGKDIQDYLLENENLYIDKIDDAISKAEYIHGSGLYDYKGMDDNSFDSEWRFECDELKMGGHL